MAKEIMRKIKLQVPAGKATPAPPVGTILGPVGVNLQEFCTKYNDATREKTGDILPVEITVYVDRTFEFVIKTPPTSFLLKKAAKIKKASKKGANEIVATLTEKDIREIAEIKLPDLNAYDIEAAMKIIEGTARNMGIAVKGVNDQELKAQAEESLEHERELAKREAELEVMEQEVEAQKEVSEEPTEETVETEKTTEEE